MFYYLWRPLFGGYLIMNYFWEINPREHSNQQISYLWIRYSLISLMERLNNWGAQCNPWGTPDNSSNDREIVRDMWIRISRKLVNSIRRSDEKPSASSCSSNKSKLTLSNAWRLNQLDLIIQNLKKVELISY